jgi:hypothetical protein
MPEPAPDPEADSSETRRIYEQRGDAVVARQQREAAMKLAQMEQARIAKEIAKLTAEQIRKQNEDTPIYEGSDDEDGAGGRHGSAKHRKAPKGGADEEEPKVQLLTELAELKKGIDYAHEISDKLPADKLKQLNAKYDMVMRAFKMITDAIGRAGEDDDIEEMFGQGFSDIRFDAQSYIKSVNDVIAEQTSRPQHEKPVLPVPGALEPVVTVPVKKELTPEEKSDYAAYLAKHKDIKLAPAHTSMFEGGVRTRKASKPAAAGAAPSATVSKRKQEWLDFKAAHPGATLTDMMMSRKGTGKKAAAARASRT